jgi:hypothetical protein
MTKGAHMSEKKEYTEEERIAFLERAKEVGKARAIRELGYPTFPTAAKWAKQYGVELPLNELSLFANELKQFYGYEEKLYAVQLLIDRTVELLNSPEALDADQIKKAGEALKRAIETSNLVEGKATSITQANNDPFNNDIEAFIEEQERINRAKQLELNE